MGGFFHQFITDWVILGCRHEAISLFNSPTVCQSSDQASRCVHMFAPSPFSLQLKDKDVPLKTILHVIRVLSKLTSEEKKMCVQNRAFYIVHFVTTTSHMYSLTFL